MSKLFKQVILIGTVLLGLFMLADKTEAATLSIVPRSDEYSLGETFVLELRLNSEQEVINAVQATITYPADMLKVVEVSKGGSFLTLWAEEPSYEESAGVISLTGGIPDGSFVVDGLVASVTFKAMVPGGIEISFDETSSSVHLNDGQGTPVATSFESAFGKISSETMVAISSPTHPDENSWYNSTVFTAEWSTEADTVYKYIVSTDPEELPAGKEQQTKGIATVTNLRDGVSYFTLSHQQPKSSWQLAGQRRVMVDTSPPLPIQAAITSEPSLYNGQAILLFSTTDKVSGVDHYDVQEGGQWTRRVVSPYILKDQSQNTPLTVWAYDKAGNSISYSLGNAHKVEQRHVIIRGGSLIIIIISVILLLAILFYYLQISNRK